MKKILILMALLFASTASANWELNQNGLSVQSSNNDQRVIAALEYNEGIYYLTFIDATNVSVGAGCKEDESVLDVNGQPVTFHFFCDRGIARAFPISEKGRKFVLDEFKNKTSVKVGNNIFSAVGFSAALIKVKNRDDWEKNAL